MCRVGVCFAVRNILPSLSTFIIIIRLEVGTQTQVKWTTQIPRQKVANRKSRSDKPLLTVSWLVGVVESISGDKVMVRWPGKREKVSQLMRKDLSPYVFSERPTPKGTRYSFTVFFGTKGAKKRKRECEEEEAVVAA